jgi:hypothetical protein
MKTPNYNLTLIEETVALALVNYIGGETKWSAIATDAKLPDKDAVLQIMWRLEAKGVLEFETCRGRTFYRFIIRVPRTTAGVNRADR